MGIIISLLGGAFAGIIIMWFVGNAKSGKLHYIIDSLTSENENYKTELRKAEIKNEENIELRTRLETSKEAFEIEKKALLGNIKLLEENFEKTKELLEKQWKEKSELMKSEFQAVANEVLEKKSGNLRSTNKEQLEAILNPLKDKLQNFEKAVNESRIAGAENKASLEKAIEEVMKRTQEIGNDAVNLTKALKGNTKTQGDWGEMILESMLEKSGLRKDEEYFIQESKTVDGERMRPDVIVRFPEKRSVIIDSKVSLKAYSAYMESETEEERKHYLKNHLKSIKDHIDELSNKNYSQYVEHSIGYVLMFVPNEASYILAVQNDASLGSYAYSKRIILISPTNLIMALQLAYNLWQSERQSQNVMEIVRQGSDLYDKFVTFAENFAKIGNQLNTVQNTYNDVSKQLSDGRGNLISRVERIRRLGLNPKKQLIVDSTAEDDIIAEEQIEATKS
ncbi:MAG: DNA recombination protein RmuC [Culturomica sp.]|jgi:DNA recombination protein RmuC|nr:DNA recombination protein RmuC [Culturomica sp.]